MTALEALQEERARHWEQKGDYRDGYRHTCPVCSVQKSEPYYNERRSWREAEDWPCITSQSLDAAIVELLRLQDENAAARRMLQDERNAVAYLDAERVGEELGWMTLRAENAERELAESEAELAQVVETAQTVYDRDIGDMKRVRAAVVTVLPILRSTRENDRWADFSPAVQALAILTDFAAPHAQHPSETLIEYEDRVNPERMEAARLELLLAQCWEAAVDTAMVQEGYPLSHPEEVIYDTFEEWLAAHPISRPPRQEEP